MNPYYFVIEVEPQRENPVIAHASRAVAHIWIMADDMDKARKGAKQYLETERWDILKEKDGVILTEEKIDAMGEEELSNYQAALSEGFHSKFYYWHRSE